MNLMANRVFCCRVRRLEYLVSVIGKYILDVSKYNLFLSVMFSIVFYLGMGISIPHGFLGSFISGGFVGGLYFFHLLQNNEYYFYFNMGLTTSRLIFAAELVNIAIFMAGEMVLFMVGLVK